MDNEFMNNSLMSNITNLINKLRDAGLDNYISMPNIIVIGTQSSGKSSIIQQIIGMDILPRVIEQLFQGVRTRRPLEIRINHQKHLQTPYAQFKEIKQNGCNLKFYNFEDVKKSIINLTDKLCGYRNEMSDVPLTLDIYSNQYHNLTIIDLPAINTIKLLNPPPLTDGVTKQMIKKYMMNPKSIILCVISAIQDIQNSQALRMLRQIDPEGQRSICCLTKIDLMDRGEDVSKILKNVYLPLRHGFIGVKNRSQYDNIQNVTVEQAIRNQRSFFSKKPIYSSLPPDVLGTQSLRKKLSQIFYQIIRQQIHKLYEDIKQKKKRIKNQLLLSQNEVLLSIEYKAQAWNKNLSQYLKILKGSLRDIKGKQHESRSLLCQIRILLDMLYEKQFCQRATQNMSDQQIKKNIFYYPSSIPSFPFIWKIDAFTYIISAMLNRLKNPALKLINDVYQLIEKQSIKIINLLISNYHPNPNLFEQISIFIHQILIKQKLKLQQYINSLLQSQYYLFTNNKNFKIDHIQHFWDMNLFITELRTDVDNYYHSIIKNLRHLIPQQIMNCLFFKFIRQIELEVIQQAGDPSKVQSILQQPAQTQVKTKILQKQLLLLQQLQINIKMNPFILKMLDERKKKQIKKLVVDHNNVKQKKQSDIESSGNLKVNKQNNKTQTAFELQEGSIGSAKNMNILLSDKNVVKVENLINNKKVNYNKLFGL